MTTLLRRPLKTLFGSIVALVLMVALNQLNAQNQPVEFYIAALSPDGTKIAGVDVTAIFRIWDAQTNTTLVDLVGSEAPPLSVAWSPDSRRIAAAGGDAMIRVWCVDTNPTPSCSFGALLAELEGHEGGITSISWGSNNQLASGGQVEWMTLRIWDMTTYELIDELNVGHVSQLAWHPNAGTLAKVSDGGALLVFDPAAIQRVAEAAEGFIGPSGPTFGTQSVAWNSDGSLIAFGTIDGRVYIYDAISRTEFFVFNDDSTSIYALAWSRDDTYLASVSAAGAIRIRNVLTLESQVIQVNRVQSVIGQISWGANNTLYYPDVGGLPPVALSISTPTSISSPTPTLTPAPLQRLRLTSVCSADPTVTRRWRVRNSNPYEVTFTWDVYNTTQTGTLTIPAASGSTPAEVFFETQAVANTSNTVRIFVDGAQQDVKASGGAVCSP